MAESKAAAGAFSVLSAYPTINEESLKVPKPENVRLRYGTAGFRKKADLVRPHTAPAPHVPHPSRPARTSPGIALRCTHAP